LKDDLLQVRIVFSFAHECSSLSLLSLLYLSVDSVLLASGCLSCKTALNTFQIGKLSQ